MDGVNEIEAVQPTENWKLEAHSSNQPFPIQK